MSPQQAPSYATSPLGSFPELSQMYATNFSSPLSNAKTSAQANQDQVTVSNAKQAEAEAKARADAFSNAKNYTVTQRPDGGFGFYGPDGKEVSAAQYASNTGQKITDVLKDSQNPIDIRYIQDAQNMTKYIQAKANSKFDPKQKAIAKQIEGQVQKAYGRNLAQENPIQLRNEFQSNYPSIYGANPGNTPGYSGSSLAYPGYAGAEAQAKANNPAGFYTPQNLSGGNGVQ